MYIAQKNIPFFLFLLHLRMYYFFGRLRECFLFFWRPWGYMTGHDICISSQTHSSTGQVSYNLNSESHKRAYSAISGKKWKIVQCNPILLLHTLPSPHA